MLTFGANNRFLNFRILVVGLFCLFKNCLFKSLLSEVGSKYSGLMYLQIPLFHLHSWKSVRQDIGFLVVCLCFLNNVKMPPTVYGCWEVIHQVNCWHIAVVYPQGVDFSEWQERMEQESSPTWVLDYLWPINLPPQPPIALAHGEAQQMPAGPRVYSPHRTLGFFSCLDFREFYFPDGSVLLEKQWFSFDHFFSSSCCNTPRGVSLPYFVDPRAGSCTVSSKTKSLLTRHSILRFKFKVEFLKMARWTLLQDRTGELTNRCVLDKMHLQNLNCPSVNVLSSLDHRRSQKIWFTVLVASLKQGSRVRCVTFTPMTYLPSQIVFYVKKRERDRGSCVFMLWRVDITTENKASQRQVRFCWFSSLRRCTGNMVEGTGVEWEWRGGVCVCVRARVHTWCKKCQNMSCLSLLSVRVWFLCEWHMVSLRRNSFSGKVLKIFFVC